MLSWRFRTDSKRNLRSFFVDPFDSALFRQWNRFDDPPGWPGWDGELLLWPDSQSHLLQCPLANPSLWESYWMFWAMNSSDLVLKSRKFHNMRIWSHSSEGFAGPYGMEQGEIWMPQGSLARLGEEYPEPCLDVVVEKGQFFRLFWCYKPLKVGWEAKLC